MFHATPVANVLPLPAGLSDTRRASTRQAALVVALGTLMCVALVLAGMRWPSLLAPAGSELLNGASRALGDTAAHAVPVHPLIEGLKLLVSALLGLYVTVVAKQTRREKPLSRAMEQAQVLLCVSGAMMMIIIGNSLARAFGIAGAASIIRFRTPVDDPKDITILFLLMALGMATGLGAFAVAGIGALCLCLLLLLLDRVGEARQRAMSLEMVAAGTEFPADAVQAVLARHGVAFEAREIAKGEDVRVKYAAMVEPAESIESLSQELVRATGGRLKSVAWEPKKNG